MKSKSLNFFLGLTVGLAIVLVVAGTTQPGGFNSLFAQVFDEIEEPTEEFDLNPVVYTYPSQQEGGNATQQPATKGPRVKLIIPGKEPILIDTTVAGDVTLIMEADGQGVQVRSQQVDITLRRGTQPGFLAMTSPMGGTFEMKGQFAWMKNGQNVLLATVGGSPTPLLGNTQSDVANQSTQPTQPQPSGGANQATVPPDTAGEAQKTPIEIVDGREGNGNQ